MFLQVFLATTAIIVVALLVFIKTSSNPVAKFLAKKVFGKKGGIKKKKLSCLVMSGPAGVGKGTLIDKLQKEYADGFSFSVSHTTRAPRDGEVNGVHYHFVSIEKFEAMIKEDAFMEYAKVHSNYYGTSKAALNTVQASGKVAIVEIDVKGAKLFKERVGKTDLICVYVFFKAPSLDELRSRMEARGKDSKEKIAERLATAEEELKFIKDHESLYDRVLENKNLEECYGRLKRILTLFGGL